jgi:hypothetical protein
MSVRNRRGTPEQPDPGTPPSAVDELSKPLPVRVPRARFHGVWSGFRRLIGRGNA